MIIKQSFEGWKRLVNLSLRTKCGMEADDLPDCPYHDWWEAGVKPTIAAQRAIKNAKES